MKKSLCILLALLLLLALAACAPAEKMTVTRKAQAEVYYLSTAEQLNVALGTDGKLYMSGQIFESNSTLTEIAPYEDLTPLQMKNLPQEVLPYLTEENAIVGQYNWKLVAEDVVDFYTPGPLYFLTADGKMFALRDDFCPQIAVPTLLAENVAKICRTYPISFITEDGGLVIQTDEERYRELEGAKAYTGVSGHPLVQIAEHVVDASNWGGRNFAYVDENGAVWVNGYNDFGTLANGKYDEVLEREYLARAMAGTPVEPEGYSLKKFYRAMTGVREVYVSGSNIFVIKQDDSLWGWGANEFGNIGSGTHGDGDVSTRDLVMKPTKILDHVVKFMGGLTGSVDDMMGENAFMALTEDGSLYTWGSNRNGNLANGEMSFTRRGDFLYADRPVKVLENVQDFSFKLSAPGFLVLLRDGSVYSWGYSAEGGVGSGLKAPAAERRGRYVPEYAVLTPTKIAEHGRYLFDTGSYMSVICDDGSILSWGNNPFGWSIKADHAESGSVNLSEVIVFATPVKNPQISAIIGEDGSVSFVPAPVE